MFIHPGSGQHPFDTCQWIVLRVSLRYTRCRPTHPIFVQWWARGFDWNNVGPASQTVAQHYTISIRPIMWCFWRRDGKRHPHSHRHAAVRKHGTITQCCFNAGPAWKPVGQHWNSIGWMPRVCAEYTADPKICECIIITESCDSYF